MDNNAFSIAEHYYNLRKFDEAYKQLTKLDLIIDRQEQIEQHILLSLVLNELNRRPEAMKIADALLRRFPDNYHCLTHWISLTWNDHRLVERSFALASNLRKSYPMDYWLPFIMAKMAFSYRLQPPKTIISLTQEAVSLYKNKQTLRLAHQVFEQFDLSERSKDSLDELVEMYPETESTYELLLNYLNRKDNYSEMSQVSYHAIRKFPHNNAFQEYYELATKQLYGDFLDKLYYTALNLGDRCIIERSSTVSWFRVLQRISALFSTFVIVAIFFSGLLFYLLGSLFFNHYVIMTSDERKIKKQRKKRLLKREFEHNDRMVETSESASALVASTHLKYRFLFLNEAGITLAEDAFCVLEELHANFDDSSLKGAIYIPRNKIRSIEVSANYLTLKTKRLGLHIVYFDHIPTLEFVTRQLEKHGYYLLQTKKSSRILLAIGCFLGAKAGLSVALLITVSTSWLVGALFALAVLSNAIGFFVYRLLHPRATDIYISRY